jgi:hypothetical protein
MRKHLKDDEFATVTDITGAYSVIAVVGPRSRELLSACSYSDFSNASFPFYTSKSVDIGPVMTNAKVCFFPFMIFHSMYHVFFVVMQVCALVVCSD